MDATTKERSLKGGQDKPQCYMVVEDIKDRGMEGVLQNERFGRRISGSRRCGEFRVWPKKFVHTRLGKKKGGFREGDTHASREENYLKHAERRLTKGQRS